MRLGTLGGGRGHRSWLRTTELKGRRKPFGWTLWRQAVQWSFQETAGDDEEEAKGVTAVFQGLTQKLSKVTGRRRRRGRRPGTG